MCFPGGAVNEGKFGTFVRAEGFDPMGAWVLIGAMLAILAGAIYAAVQGWNAHGPMDTPASLDAALIFGGLFTLIVGCGLMALVFYSSRKGYDEPSRRELTDDGPEAPLEPDRQPNRLPSRADDPRNAQGSD
jgi:hypothetical protein